MSVDASNTKVLVLGAYGLIGVDIVNALECAGYPIVALGRDSTKATRILPNRDWVIRDIANLKSMRDWDGVLSGISTVVNCSGALQSGINNDLEDLHHNAVSALARSCSEHDIRLIQISAIGAELDATTDFLASKARGDAAIQKAMCDYVIVKPGMVLSQTAYGGSLMVRMAAAVPLVQPLLFGDARVQTVSSIDLANFVVSSVADEAEKAQQIELCEQDTHSLRELILAYRNWLGFGEPRCTVSLPRWCAKPIAFVADQLAYLGWRSPLRTTAMIVLRDGVVASAVRDRSFKVNTLAQTLQANSARAEDRLFARSSLLMPLVILILSSFWTLSGVLAILAVHDAARVLTDVGWSSALSVASVLFWAVVDIVLGVTILVRKYAKMATLGMILVSLIYLVCSTFFVPALWLDPLGPLVKILPSIGLALVANIMLVSR